MSFGLCFKSQYITSPGPIQSLAPSMSHVSLLLFSTGFDQPFGIRKKIFMAFSLYHICISLDRASPTAVSNSRPDGLSFEISHSNEVWYSEWSSNRNPVRALKYHFEGFLTKE